MTAKHAFQFSWQEPFWFPAISWKEVHFGDLRGYGEAAPIIPTGASLRTGQVLN
jgi:hypothetical protein